MKITRHLSLASVLAVALCVAAPAPAHAGFLDSLKKVLNPFSSPKDKIAGKTELAKHKFSAAQDKADLHIDGAKHKFGMAQDKAGRYRDGAEHKFGMAQDKAGRYRDGAEHKFGMAQDKAGRYRDGAEHKYGMAQDKAERYRDGAEHKFEQATREETLARLALVGSPEQTGALLSTAVALETTDRVASSETFNNVRSSRSTRQRTPREARNEAYQQHCRAAMGLNSCWQP